MKRYDRTGLALGAAAIMLAAIFIGCQGQGTNVTVTQAPKVDPVTRGRYLVTIMSCNDCHTPLKMTDKGPVPDTTRMLSGHPQDLKMPTPQKLAPGPWQYLMAGTMTAFAGPWGATFAPNLTPDSATGLGTWSYDKFAKTMKTGFLADDNRPFMPPMPWYSLAALSDEDLRAVYAYLQNITPIKNQAPEFIPPKAAKPEPSADEGGD
jgi:mono/diheme cytochrome c family protein